MFKVKKISFVYAILFFGQVVLCQGQTFTNATPTTCGSDFGTGPNSLQQKLIAVSGLPTGGLSAVGVVLTQINIKLGTSSCDGDLSTYSLTLVNPAHTQTLTISNKLFSSTISSYIDVHYRDNYALKRLRDYTTLVQWDYLPHSIGYYRVETANSFSNFNDGSNPNGNWILNVLENTSSEVSFQKVDLVFGSPIFVYDISGSTANNSCSSAYCFDLTGVTVGTNNGYSTNDPHYPGNTVNGCSWNGSNDNSAWFEFQASATTSYISLSGISAGVSAQETQPIILKEMPTSCTTPTSVPTGGCPYDYTHNDLSYLTVNSDPYNGGDGISDNAEFNLSGLTIGQNYYLYIDGYGGTGTTFYIEGLSGLATCSIVLPVTWVNVKTICSNTGNTITWTVANQINNKCFEILKSTDGINFYSIGNIKGDGNYEYIKTFTYKDNENNFSLQNYYKIRQIDLNGRYTESTIVYCQTENTQSITIGSNPFTSSLNIINSAGTISVVEVYDAIGRKMTEMMDTENLKTLTVESYNWQGGVYFIHIITKDSDKPLIIKAIKTVE